jgi:hypothetical protein
MANTGHWQQHPFLYKQTMQTAQRTSRLQLKKKDVAMLDASQKLADDVATVNNQTADSLHEAGLAEPPQLSNFFQNVMPDASLPSKAPVHDAFCPLCCALLLQSDHICQPALRYRLCICFVFRFEWPSVTVGPLV